ncbi:Uncharacterised protein [Tatumella ptyseos]|uniref:Uncharacterized protein n=1 Tax=Tatumella ptyseos TaxID=82987 RepID=A0A2X5RB88_9GAMM|nr:Uncharacterised protein [Tatumella ptyseos]
MKQERLKFNVAFTRYSLPDNADSRLRMEQLTRRSK